MRLMHSRAEEEQAAALLELHNCGEIDLNGESPPDMMAPGLLTILGVMLGFLVGLVITAGMLIAQFGSTLYAVYGERKNKCTD